MPYHFYLRSRFYFGFAFVVFFMSFALAPSAQAVPKKDKAVIFMERVAKKLMAAVKSGSKEKLRRVITSYADIKDIGKYSLGDYAKKLPRSRRTIYNRGVAKFMARYLMGQSKQYNIASAKITGLGGLRKDYVLVDSEVFLEEGLKYDVQWRLKKHKNTFKIRDAKVLGFWLIPFQRDLFNNFVTEQGGDVNALVLALNY